MAAVNCHVCEEQVLTEADPYIVFPKPSGYEILCMDCGLNRWEVHNR